MFGRFRHLPLLRQAEVTECGHACLAMVAAWFGHQIDLVSLRLQQSTSANGISVHSLQTMAEQLGLRGRALRLEPEMLDRLKLPAILHWDMNHFVVLKSVSRNRAVIHDPTLGVLRMSMRELAQHFTGIAIEFSEAEGFKPIRSERRLPLASLFAGVGELGWPIFQVVLLSCLLKALVLISPWYLQLAVDNAIPSGDTHLLLLLGGGFAVVALFRLVNDLTRTLLQVFIQSRLDLTMSSRLFTHMLRLPMPFFVKRDDGDLLSRFESLNPIRAFMANGAVLAMIDGALAVVALVFLLAVSPLLAAVSAIGLAAYGLLRVVFYEPLFRRGEETVRAEAGYTTMLIESIRTVQAIKLANAEGKRESQFITRSAEAIHCRAAEQRLTGLFSALRETMFMLEDVAFILVASYLAVEGRMTIGVLYALLAYKTLFISGGAELIESFIGLRLLRLHIDRVSDIAVSETEPAYAHPMLERAPLAGLIDLAGVSYRYAASEPYIFHGLTERIEPGECVAIVGPSGCGKTTLVKVMLGLFPPTEGEVRVDGVALPVFGERAYRRQVASVMQDDHLMIGTVLQNICLFDDVPDTDFATECARLACIHDEIMRMPMGYRTVIGSLGSTLSAGQRQRVLLARALYRRPRILFIDEGTANLDVELEKRINEMLVRLPITRIYVAHRPQTIALADRVIDLRRSAHSLDGSMRRGPERPGGRVAAAIAPADLRVS